MNLLRYYLMVGGERLDASAYAAACEDNKIQTGKLRYVKNPKTKNHEGVSVLIESGVPGTFGDGYSVWQSETVNYALDENEFLRQSSMPMTSEYSQLWKGEENAMMNFLLPFKTRMPDVSSYCAGDYFIIFKIIYGSFDEGGCAFPGYSRSIINILAEIGAGIESDCESYRIHFSRLRNH